MTREAQDQQRGEQDACGACPVATSRRAFLRDVGMAAAAAVSAIALGRPALALAERVEEIEPVGTRLLERSYAIPRADSVSVDAANNVILVRWENRVYAFSLKCPHKGARLEWRDVEQRVYCPKHKARFLPSGAHVSGRGSRDLDRYAISRGAGGIAVDLGRAYRKDNDRTEWEAAVIVIA